MALSTASARPLAAQTIIGRVLDEARGSPVAGAIVRLLDEKDDEKAQTLADSLGRFTLAAPRDGRYVLEAVRLGYESTRSPLLAMHTGGGRVPVDLMVTPQPIGLEGFEVTVEEQAEELLAPLGLTPQRLGNRWIDRAFIDSVQMKADIGSVIRWRGMPGIYVRNFDTGSSSLCIQLQRGRRVGSGNTCALLVLDGAVISAEAVALMDPDIFEAAAVLMPTEATAFWGTMGGTGAVLLWTRRGGARR